MYISNNGRKVQLPNGVCVREDVNAETEMFVLSEDIVLVLYTPASEPKLMFTPALQSHKCQQETRDPENKTSSR